MIIFEGQGYILCKEERPFIILQEIHRLETLFFILINNYLEKLMILGIQFLSLKNF